MFRPKRKSLRLAKQATSSAVDAASGQAVPQVAMPFQSSTELFRGPVAHPEILRGYEAVVPGSAAKLMQLAEEESLHRRQIEDRSNVANVEAQGRQLAILDYQARAIFRSDMIGQIAGFLISISCVAGAVYLAMNKHEAVAGALTALPTAAVIQAFFAKRPGQPAGKDGPAPPGQG